MRKLRTAFVVAMAYVFVISAIISPLKSAFNLANSTLAGGTVICLTGVDGSHDPLKDTQHNHQSDCCVVCGRLDLATPALGAVVDIIAITVRLPSETIRFALFQSRAPPDFVPSDHKARAPPVPA